MKLIMENWRTHTVSEGWFSRTPAEMREKFLIKLLKFKDFRDLVREKDYRGVEGVVIEFGFKYPNAEIVVPELRLGEDRPEGYRGKRAKWRVEDLINLYVPEAFRADAPKGSLSIADPEGGELSMTDQEGGLSLQEDIDFSTFKLKETLNPKIWDGDRIHPEVAQKLMEIANDFWAGLDLKDVDIVDIIITGSIANYNWTRMSDVDLHILVNFDDVDENTDLVGAFFRNVRANWNKTHNIMIKGHEVEVYVQEASEPHVSTGVYSLFRDEWEITPTYQEVTIDEAQVARKADCLMDLVNKVENEYNRGNYPEAYEEALRIRDKIGSFRKCGLETGGEFSPENLAFKVLRRNGYLGKLTQIRRDAYDHMMSLNGGCKPAAGIRVKVG